MSKRSATFAGIEKKRRSAATRKRQRALATQMGILPPLAIRSGAARELELAQMARARTQKELKGVDVSLAISPVLGSTNTNGSCTLLNAIAPGTGSYNRVGRKVHLKSIRLKGDMYVLIDQTAEGATLTDALVRMVVVWDKQPSGTLPTYDAIFGQTDQAGSEACNLWDTLRYDNTDRFTVLRDKMFLVRNNFANNSAAGNPGANVMLQEFDEFIPLQGRETQYSGQSSTCTIADISTGGLYVYWRSRNNTPSEHVVTIENSQGRLRYYD